MTNHGDRLVSDIQSLNKACTYILILAPAEEIFMGKSLHQQFSQH